MRPWLLLFLLVPLAGCTGDAGQRVDLPAIDWSVPLAVETTAVEPWELRGLLQVGWRDGLFGIEASNEPDLHQRTIRDGATLYVTDAGRGWTRLGTDEAFEDGHLSTRVLLWDLRRLVEDPGLEHRVEQEGARTHIDVAGALRHERAEVAFEARVTVEQGRVVAARVEADRARESPFTFAPTPRALGFPLQVPTHAMSPADIAEAQRQARAGHVFLIGLLHDHADARAGSLPAEVTPESLRVELALSGEPWPTNPFDGRPLEAADTSGHFRWRRCTATTGAFEGLGWDVALLGESYGSGCTLPPGP